MSMSERMAGNLSSTTPPAEKSGRGMLWRVLGVLFGCVCLTIGIRDFRRAHDSTSWPTVPGTIQRAEVEQHVDFDGPSYSADIAYAYTVPVGSTPATLLRTVITDSSCRGMPAKSWHGIRPACG